MLPATRRMMNCPRRSLGFGRLTVQQTISTSTMTPAPVSDDRSAKREFFLDLNPGRTLLPNPHPNYSEKKPKPS